MRRVTLALLGAVAATVVLVGLKTPMLAAPLGYAVATPVGPPTDGSEAASDPAATSSGAPPAAGPATTPGATGPAAIPPSGPSSAPAPPAPPPPAPPAPPASRTITGSAIAAVWRGENFGNMQVKIVVTGSRIDDIIAIAQSNRPKTVATELRRQALTAQSANVGNVSGATASSNAYKESLASAIAQI
jgi:hypothetical protein